MPLSDRAVGCGLAGVVITFAVAGFPVALGVGAAMYIALHLTRSGQRYRDLMDALAADEPAQEAGQENADEEVAA